MANANMLLDLLIAGFLQGILEWLPVSSSGQVMVFLAKIFSMDLTVAYSFTLFLHLGTVLSAIVFFGKKIINELRTSLFLLKFWIYVTLVSVVVGYPIYYFYRKIIGQLSLDVVSLSIGFLLILTGFIAFKVERRTASKENVTLRDMVFLGLAQGVSVIPGISRSGITIALLLWLGFKPERAVELSFLASIPVIILAGIYASLETQINITGMVGLLSSFISGLISIGVMVSLAKKLPMHYFMLTIGALMVLIIGVSLVF